MPRLTIERRYSGTYRIYNNKDLDVMAHTLEAALLLAMRKYGMDASDIRTAFDASQVLDELVGLEEIA